MVKASAGTRRCQAVLVSRLVAHRNLRQSPSASAEGTRHTEPFFGGSSSSLDELDLHARLVNDSRRRVSMLLTASLDVSERRGDA